MTDILTKNELCRPFIHINITCVDKLKKTKKSEGQKGHWTRGNKINNWDKSYVGHSFIVNDFWNKINNWEYNKIKFYIGHLILGLIK